MIEKKTNWLERIELIRDSNRNELFVEIVVALKQGNSISFADADDYVLDNENGWLNIYKDGIKRASIPLSQVESVIRLD